MAQIDSFLRYVSDINGINKPMMYVGSWKTSFQIHQEDMNLGS